MRRKKIVNKVTNTLTTNILPEYIKLINWSGSFCKCCDIAASLEDDLDDLFDECISLPQKHHLRFDIASF